MNHGGTDEITIQSLKPTVFPSKPHRREKTWYQRSIIIFFLNHPLLGKNNLAKTSAIFSVPAGENRHHFPTFEANLFVETIRGWAKPTSQSVAKWLPFVKNLNIGIVQESLPKHQAFRYQDLDPSSRLPDSFIESAQKKLKSQSLKQSLISMGDAQNFSVQKMSRIHQQSDSSVLHLKLKDKRISVCKAGESVKLGRRNAHPNEEDYAMAFITQR